MKNFLQTELVMILWIDCAQQNPRRSFRGRAQEREALREGLWKPNGPVRQRVKLRRQGSREQRRLEMERFQCAA